MKNVNEVKITGVVVSAPQHSTGNTNGKEWNKLNFQVSTEIDYSEKYTEKNTIDVAFYGKAIDKVANVEIGQILDLSGSLNSREYNGKWYTNFKVFSAEIVGGESRSKKDDANDIYIETNDDSGDLLPF